MSQPADPCALADIVSPALDGIIHALSDRDGRTEAQREAKAGQFRALILSFRPNDVIDLEFAGQTVLFSEVLADSARDVLRGMDDALKPRTISGLISMGRIMQGNLDRLEKRGRGLHRPASTAPQEDKPSLPIVRPSVAEPPAAAAPASPEAESLSLTDDRQLPETTAQTAGKMLTEPPSQEPSWLDEPFEQWLIETPADLAAKAGLIQNAPAPANGAAHGNGLAANRADELREPALPLRPEGYAQARTLSARTPPAGTSPARTLLDATGPAD